MKSNNTMVIILLAVIVIGGYWYYKHDQNTATINLPGDKKIEITQ